MNLSWGEWMRFAALPALRAGLADSVNPGGLLALLLFICFLYFVSMVGGRIFYSGCVFLVAAVILTTVLNTGLFDGFLICKIYDRFLHWSLVFFVTFDFIIGIILLRDWWIYLRSHREERLLVPFPFLDQARDVVKSKSHLQNRAVLLLLSLLTAGVTMLLAVAWPPNIYVTIILYQLTLPGYLLRAGFLLLLYSLGTIVPMLTVLLILDRIFISRMRVIRLQNVLSKVQIISAAVFLSYAISFIFFYIW